MENGGISFSSRHSPTRKTSGLDTLAILLRRRTALRIPVCVTKVHTQTVRRTESLLAIDCSRCLPLRTLIKMGHQFTWHSLKLQ